MPLTIADELMVLALGTTSKTTHHPWLEFGIAGALLAELVIDGRAYLDDNGLVTPGEDVSHGDPDLDRLAEQITDRSEHGERGYGWLTVTSPPREPSWWVAQTADGRLTKHRCETLLARGLIVDTEYRRGVVVTYGYRLTNPEAHTSRVRNLGDILTGTAPPTPRAVTLLALVRAIGLERPLFSGVLSGQYDPDINEELATDTVGAAVREIIRTNRATSHYLLLFNSGKFDV